MSYNGQLQEQLEKDLLTCPICCSQFKDPRVLKCQHSFCYGCLKGYVAAKRPLTHSIPCAVCRTSTPMPSRGVDGIPSNLVLKGLLQVMRKNENSASVASSSRSGFGDYSTMDRSVKSGSRSGCSISAGKSSGCTKSSVSFCSRSTYSGCCKGSKSGGSRSACSSSKCCKSTSATYGAASSTGCCGSSSYYSSYPDCTISYSRCQKSSGGSCSVYAKLTSDYMRSSGQSCFTVGTSGCSKTYRCGKTSGCCQGMKFRSKCTADDASDSEFSDSFDSSSYSSTD